MRDGPMIRWPFVSRAGHEQLVAQLRQDLEFERARTKELTTTLLELKTAGAVYAPRTTRNVRMTRPPRSKLQQAIDENEYASSNPMLRRHLTEWGESELAKPGADEDAIAERLRSWSVPKARDDDDDDEDDDTVIAIGGDDNPDGEFDAESDLDDVADGITGDEERD